MLPSRSKRYVGIDGEIVRLELAANWQLTLVALLVLGLLTAIFPRKALIEQLYQQETLDDLTLSYVQNLYRTNPNNSDAALLLARTQAASLGIRQLESLLMGLTKAGDLRQRYEARALLVQAYLRQLDQATDTDEVKRMQTRVTGMLQAAQHDAMPDHLTQRFGDLAFKLNLPDLGLIFYKKLALAQSAEGVERFADLLLAKGQHAAAAHYYFLARERSDSLDESRRLFQLGIRTLMAAGLYRQAMQAAQAKLGDLAQDRPSLRFLASTALAAGDPAAAAAYARRLVFQ